MKLLKKFTHLIVVIFFKLEIFYQIIIFNVNNIILEKKRNKSNKQLADQAIKKGFDQFLNKVLMKEDINKINNLNITDIKNLVSYYNVSRT